MDIRDLDDLERVEMAAWKEKCWLCGCALPVDQLEHNLVTNSWLCPPCLDVADAVKENSPSKLRKGFLEKVLSVLSVRPVVRSA